MITKESIASLIAGYLADNGLFQVDIEISAENDIVITIESYQGSVTLDNCTAIDAAVTGRFNKDMEDYSLTVTSAGLDQPFKVAQQYVKFTGSEVEITLKKGGRIKGILSEYCNGGEDGAVQNGQARRGKEEDRAADHCILPYGRGKGVQACHKVQINVKKDNKMEGLNLVSTFAEFKELKNIDRPTMMSVLEDIFRTQLARMYGSADNFDIIINIDKGDFEIWRNRTVVETVEDPNTQISKEDVDKIDSSYEIGEEFVEPVSLASFGRRGILNLRQNLQARIADIEKANLYNK